ncbi:MAG: hypothetical protein NVS3B14_15440 [Ktedonobacteraceae bacterium]
MQQSRSWRDMLAEVIRDAHEKQHMAQALGVNQMTLVRWASNQSKPRYQHHKKLLDAFPAQHKQEFSVLFAEEFPESREPLSEQSEEPVEEIPSAFYARIFSAYTHSPRELRTSSLFSLVLQQMLSHFDTDQEGLSISVVLCTFPFPGQPVRSLHEHTGRGTSPFKSHAGLQPYFLGAESMAGFAVTHCRELINQNLREGAGYTPFLRTEWEESAMAYPILFENRIAGCSLVASTRVNFFTPTRQRLVQEYTNLMVLALDREDFYKPSDVALRVLPSQAEQQPFFARFQQRTIDTMTRLSAAGNEGITRAAAEAIALREVEEEILSKNYV